jgi:hypothetical protein
VTDLLLDLSDLRDAAEDCQTFSRLAAEEQDATKRSEWRAKARHAMGVVRMKTASVDAAIAGLT